MFVLAMGKHLSDWLLYNALGLVLKRCFGGLMIRIAVGVGLGRATTAGETFVGALAELTAMDGRFAGKALGGVDVLWWFAAAECDRGVFGSEKGGVFGIHLAASHKSFPQ